ncbi:Glucose-6-phosphate/phosphate translocator 1, chloroplastic [Gracilariopsis chorda]|uniref:Glucose-6-phosphate/phosphate translocator 1, chloroplastic n=1 Tax=Gracilariopsis chorda TaxID=448386 RepID=A0A2V3IKN0_9FLOR|nr:Glucose-6-phosphate/phosphate translocator 1, chloroplastic [Gracilariopsis chorda]|eukprot:PXF42656.1 Glucose-6-phosphate/phosphate translocator 1, chloroplastic [Gracilariopsis chorda]
MVGIVSFTALTRGPSYSRVSLLAILFLVWWACNSIYAIDAQLLLTKFPSDLLFVDLSFSQILVGMLMAYMLSLSKPSVLQTKGKETTPSLQQDNRFFSFSLRPFRTIALAIGFFHLVGTLLTNSSYRLIGSTSTLMWKLTEPLAALLLKRVILGEPTSVLSFFGMLMVLGGVIMFSEHSFTVLTVSPIVLANLCLPLRNILMKRDQRSLSKNMTTEQRFFMLQVCSLPFGVLILLYKLIFHGFSMPSFPYLLRNAVLFNSYQFASIALLEMMDALTHSLLNTLKRFSGIIISAIVLGDSLNLSHIAGLALAGMGFPLYLAGKETDAMKSRRNSKRTFLAVQFLLLLAVIFSSCRDAVEKSPSLPDISKTTSPLSAPNHTLTLPVSVQTLSFGKDRQAPSLGDSDLRGETSNATALSSRTHEHPIAFSSTTNGDSIQKYVVSNCVKYPRADIVYKRYEEALKDTGKNHGNLVWQYATMHRLVDFTSSLTCNRTRSVCSKKVPEVEDRKMLYYRPIANIFDLGVQMLFEFERRVVEEDGDVMLLIGIGIQHSFQRNIRVEDLSPGEQIRTSAKDFEFTEPAKAMLQTMQAHKVPMLMRGSFTLEAARLAGYEYGVAAGCPSLFINNDVHLGRSLQLKYEALKRRIGDRTLKVAINMKPQKKITGFLASLLEEYPNSYMYVQTLEDLTQMKEAGIPFKRLRFISDAEEWMESLRTMDVAFGARIHGNMIALGAGIPAFVIAPDHRVLELVERMKVPYTTYYDKRLVHGLDVAKLVTDVGFSGEEFDRNRCDIAKLYKKVFGRYGLRLSRHAEQISAIC